MNASTDTEPLAPRLQRGLDRRRVRVLRAAFSAFGTIFALLILSLGGASAAELGAQDSRGSHDSWSSLLAQCVRSTSGGHSTVADYDCFQNEHARLKAYLQTLESVQRADFEQWNKNEQMAFLINSYNAWTVELILSEWPKLESIKDLGSFFRSPWKKAFIPLLGQTLSLDDIEHGMIREPGRFDEPRIHFAVNCASIGCPSLRAEAYTAEALEAQLQAQTEQFLGDTSRNRVGPRGAEVSSIFKWYRDDFEQGWRGAASLEQFLALYADTLGADASMATRLRNGNVPVSFLDYDWKLNAPT